METLPRFGISRADMMKRVARFNELKGSDGGLPDSKAPQCERTLYNVIGFQPPKESGGAARMFHMGQERTFADVRITSAYLPVADSYGHSGMSVQGRSLPLI